MAEVIATITIVSSIASLIDISAKVVSRLHELSSQNSDIPESLRPLSIRLPLLIDTLKRIKTQATAGSLSNAGKDALAAVVSNITEQVSTVYDLLSRVLPLDAASRPERIVRTLKSIAKEDKVHKAWDRIDESIGVLLLYQTSKHTDTAELILAQLSELTLIAKSSTSWPVVKDERQSLARTAGHTVIEKSPSSGRQTFALLHNSNEDIITRFSHLPISLQEQFMAEQEDQLIRFVEQSEATLLGFFTVFDAQDLVAKSRACRASGTCDWILESKAFLEWFQGNCNRLWLSGIPGAGKTITYAFVLEALYGRTTNGDIIATFACDLKDLEKSSPTNVLLALAGQIAQKSPASMEKAKLFLRRHVSNGQLRPKTLDLQDLIVEMSLSTDIRRIFIVIDGLDEVDRLQSEDVKVIVDIPKCARKVKMFVTNREDDCLRKALHKYTTFGFPQPTGQNCSTDSDD
ncbi:MAG: hypothetical protein Q9169_007141 [Polycauliona sp. 2 TL-2023]